MSAHSIADFLESFTYAFLAFNLLFGLQSAVLVWRRLRVLRFRKPEEEHDFVEEMKESMAMGDFARAEEMCEGDARALPSLVGLLLANRDLEDAQLRHLAAEHLQADVVAPLENKVQWVLTVIRNGPLLGLFGTVLGMMAAFGRIGTGEKVQPSQIADEISIALICTALGLGTAIPLGYVASSLTMRIRQLQESLSHTLVRLLDRMKGAYV